MTSIDANEVFFRLSEIQCSMNSMIDFTEGVHVATKGTPAYDALEFVLEKMRHIRGLASDLRFECGAMEDKE